MNNGIKLGFRLSDFAAKRGFKYTSFRLQDGSTASILSNPKKNISEFYHTKGDCLLGVKGYRGRNSYIAALDLMQKLAKKANNAHEACTAWSVSINRYV